MRGLDIGTNCVLIIGANVLKIRGEENYNVINLNSASQTAAQGNTVAGQREVEAAMPSAG